MFVFFIHFWNLGKISIFLAFSGSFAEKNDNIHFFSMVWSKFLNLPALLQRKIHGLDYFHGNGPYCKIPTEEELTRAHRFA